jgi:hypothetical protein
MIIMLFLQKAPRYILILTAMLILGNYLITSPSSSILTPSGNLFKSRALLENRMVELHSKAKEITGIKEDKIVLLGYFHNPYIVYEILRSTPFYKAEKIGRENYKIITKNNEYLIFYVIPGNQEELNSMIDSIITLYNANDYYFISTTYDLQFLKDRGLKTKSLDIIKSTL